MLMAISFKGRSPKLVDSLAASAARLMVSTRLSFASGSGFSSAANFFSGGGTLYVYVTVCMASLECDLPLDRLPHISQRDGIQPAAGGGATQEKKTYKRALSDP